LATANESDLLSAIKEVSPRILAVGARPVGVQIMRAWRDITPDGPLSIVRRGTSLAAIDLDEARSLSIDVFNTPAVNAPFVASYVIDYLFNASRKISVLSILGAGAIGSR
jgi:phosphoglycerate dehydrogenase-like enzyme